MRAALWVVLVVAALGAAVGVYVASGLPDGLERVAADLGVGAGRSGGTRAPGADGDAAAPRSRARRSALALLGGLATGGVAYGVGRLLARGRQPRVRED